MKRKLLAFAICLAFLSPTQESKAQYDGSLPSVFQFEAWAKKRHAKTYRKKRYVANRRYKARSYRVSRSSGGSASLSGIVARLRSQCGAKVISSHRPGSRTPGGQQSCHATGQAVDMTGNYACMYGVLKSWPGGYTTDAGRCRHIHISSCKMEWGMRFNHRTC